MTELERFKKSLDSLAETKEEIINSSNRLLRALKEVDSIMRNAENFTKGVSPPTGKAVIVRQNEFSIMNEYLIPSFSFKSTETIATYLKNHDSAFEELNNMNIGILLSKCGFKPGHKNKSRGFYVSYTKL